MSVQNHPRLSTKEAELLWSQEQEKIDRGEMKRPEWLTWIVCNITAAVGDDSDIKSGDVLMSYDSPKAEGGLGNHRYNAMIFKQSGRLDPKSFK